MWSRFTRGMQDQARELAHIGARLETTCPPLAQDDGFDTVFPSAHNYLDPDKPTRISDLLLMITLGLGCLADSPPWMIALGHAGVIAMLIWLSVCILSRWWASIIMIRHRHAVAPGQYVRALVGIALTLPQAYASADVAVDPVCWHLTTTSSASWSSISVALFCIICGWVLGDIVRNRASRIVAHTVYLQGPTDPQRRNVPAIRACAAINFNGEFQGQRLGMLDSGCNSLVMRFDDELRKHMSHWDRTDISRGDAANDSMALSARMEPHTLASIYNSTMRIIRLACYMLRLRPHCAINFSGIYFLRDGFRISVIVSYSRVLSLLLTLRTQGISRFVYTSSMITADAN